MFLSGSMQNANNAGEKYVIESIIDDKKEGQCNYYLVKWINYPESQNTWEPTKNVRHDDAYKEYKV
jgi:hypothetical protein